MKICKKCEQQLPSSSFSPHKNSSDGLQCVCKPCRAAEQAMWKIRNPVAYANARRAYNETQRGREKHREDSRLYRKRHPHKKVAQNIIAHGVRDGAVVRPRMCEMCMKEDDRLHGHHDDYSKPDVVRWLCVSCHKNVHSMKGVEVNDQQLRGCVPLVSGECSPD